MLRNFRTIFSEYADKKLYGMIADVHTSQEALESARKAGFYVLTFEHNLLPRVHDEDGFTAKAY